VREREDLPAEEKYAELDGNSTPAEQREEPEVEIADEAWGEQTSGPSDTPGRATMTAAAISATSMVKPCKNSSSNSWSSPSCPPSTWRSRASSPMPSPTTVISRTSSKISARVCCPRSRPTTADVERVLHAVQSLEPAGVGARNLGECIALQLRQLHPDTPARDTAIRVALEHLDLVAGQQLVLLRRQLRCSESDLEMALALVRSCHPRPGAAVNPAQAEYVIPDVFVRRTEHGWIVEINPATVPRVRVNNAYANLISRSPDHAMLRTQLQEARWLMRSLEIRNETLIKVARCIVQRQTSFFELGEEAMEPLILKDVRRSRGNARIDDFAGNHRQIHAHAARRVRVPVFLSSHVEAADGTEMSSTAIRAKIKKLISQENPENPWSDSKLAEILSQEGIPVARRTVAKYREGMQIAPSNERKRAAARAS